MITIMKHNLIGKAMHPTAGGAALRQGCSDILFERACADYRAGRITLSRAAERAGLSLRDLVARLPSSGVELNYDVQAFEEDLKP